MKITHSTAAIHCPTIHWNSQWPHPLCIINTAGREKWWISVRATLGIFSNPSLSGTLLKALASPTLPQLSGYAQLRCNNPNSHSLQFPHLCLHTHLPYVHNHLCRCFFPFLEDQRHWSTYCWAEGRRDFTHYRPDTLLRLLGWSSSFAHHYFLRDKGLVLHNSVS